MSSNNFLRNNMPFSLFYVTHPSKPEAIRITTELLNQHLIACASFYPTESMYWWEGRLAKSDEIMTIYKALTENTHKIQDTIASLHKYEIPCIIKIAEVTANDSYEQWIQSETR
jgi:periplasmic divalent cation tolerance protein